MNIYPKEQVIQLPRKDFDTSDLQGETNEAEYWAIADLGTASYSNLSPTCSFQSRHIWLH